MKRFFLIDGNAILHRAYHSIPPFKTSKGEVTNAVYGFIRMLFDLYKREKPDYLGIAWDRAAPTFRHEQYADYKATRAAPPDDLYPQLPRLKEIIEAFNIPQLEMDGYEADDVLGTIATKARAENDLQTIILTGDQDALQLVDDEKTLIMCPITGLSKTKIYNEMAVKEKLGIEPSQVIDYKAICGDTSDNIRGVPGIGPKGASDLLSKYGNLDGVYNNLDHLPAGQQKKLVEGRESAFQSRELATIICDAPFPFRLSDFSVHKIDYEKVSLLFADLEFRTLSNKLEDLKKQIPPIIVEQSSIF